MGRPFPRLPRLVHVLLLCGLGLAVAAGHPARAERAVERLPATDIPGSDYDIRRGVSLSACEAACLGDTRCRAFTYNESARWCFLKHTAGQTAPFAGATSGRIVETAAAEEPLPLPDVSALPEDVAREAEALATRAAAAARTGETVGNFTPERARRLAADPREWLRLSRAILEARGDGGDWRARRGRMRDAAAAAFAGLARAPTTAVQADALALVSRALAEQGIWRPAIAALRTSLDLAASPARADRLARLEAEHGFRVLDYTVDSDTASPRMCVQYSEEVAGTAASLAPYVAVEGIPSPVLSVSDNQLCVEGLAHGERYRVTVRPGIRSTLGDRIDRPADFVFFVRDRAPSARFAGNAYVLPRAAGGGVPVTTVNTDALSLELLRIDDRGLAGAIRSGDFRRGLSPWEVRTIREETGAVVWTGTMAVESVLNEPVTTAFPVGETVGRLEPGVYVLVATPVESTDEWSTRATQWFVVSDLGLAAYSSQDAVDVFVRSLATAEPVEGAAVRVVARNDSILGRGTTDARGHVRIAVPGAGAADGGRAPALVTATLRAPAEPSGDAAEAGGGEAVPTTIAETPPGGAPRPAAESAADAPATDGAPVDYAFLSLAAGAFDLSDRGVTGRAAPGPVDVFLTAERGVYRGGETVNLTMLARDDAARSLGDVPITVVVTRPDGVEALRRVVRSDAAGGSHVPVDLLATAMTGTWRVAAHLDPEAPAVGETTFLVEDFVPQRIAVNVSTDAERVARGGAIPVAVDARFLYGAPGADLRVEGSVVVRPPEDGLAGHPGYRFGLADDPVTPVRRTLLDTPRTGADGTARLDAPLPALPQTTRPLEAVVTIGVAEPGGRVVEGEVAVPVAAEGPLVGVRPAFSGDRVAEGGTAAFDVIALGADRARRTLEGLAWRLVEVNRTFQAYRVDGRWRYEPVESTALVADGTIDVAADAVARIEAPVEWGRYRLEVAVPGSATSATSVPFTAGWVNVSAEAETPDLLEVHLDGDRFAPGETAELRIVPRFAGKALVTVLGEGVEYVALVDVPAEGATVPITVEADWGPGAYVTAALYRPGEGGAAADARLPGRAIGLEWLSLDHGPATLDVDLALPETTRPRTRLEVPVALDGLEPGESAYLTVAAVDVGILNLTAFEPPDPVSWYFGQRRLGVELRDLWGALIDNRGAPLGRVRTGGDGGALSAAVLPPTETPVSLFSGLVAADANGEATVTFDLPAFQGTLEVMAIAWTADAVGNASADVVVRDPVVLSASLPRFLAPDDASRVRVDLDNVEGPAGEYRLTLAAEGPVAIQEATRTIAIDPGERASATFPLAATGVGTATVEMRLEGPDGLSLVDSFALPVRPAAAPVTRRILRALAPGGSLPVGRDTFAGLLGETASLGLSVQAGAPIDVPGLLTMLDRFPFGCAEQTTSRALPLLYVGDLARRIGLAADRDVPARVDEAIRTVLSFQDSSGAFGLWGPGGYDLWLTAYVMDFLTRARERGFDVPDRAFEAGLDRLQSELSYTANLSPGRASDVAYASAVLARNGRAAIGDLRYFAQEESGAFESAIAKAQLGAALAAVGDRARADALFAAAASVAAADAAPVHDVFGTRVRDAAAALALAAENGAAAGTIARLEQALEAALDRSGTERRTTQEAVWLVLAAHALGDARGGMRLAVDGRPHDGAWFARLAPAALADDPIEIANRGEETVVATLAVRGVPLRPQGPAESGFTVRKRYYTLDGQALGAGAASSAGAGTGAPFEVAQNERLVVVLEATPLGDADGRILMVDPLPAGFEIENPRLVSGADQAALAWLPDGPAPEHLAFRDDRFAAAWNLAEADGPLRVAYMVRAVTPGTYAHPAATVEDMYRPGRYARTAAGTVVVSAPR